VSKLNIKEMGSRYLFIVLYVWLERRLSGGDYHRRHGTTAGEPSRGTPIPPGAEIESRPLRR
jgi:dolichol-phosphate mannosyltransferase